MNDKTLHVPLAFTLERTPVNCAEPFTGGQGAFISRWTEVQLKRRGKYLQSEQKGGCGCRTEVEVIALNHSAVLPALRVMLAGDCAGPLSIDLSMSSTG